MSRLMVLEGLDGSGKSTQFERILMRFQQEGKAVRGISFPDYDEPSSALVRMYLDGELGDSATEVNAYAASSFYAVDRYASFVRHWKKDYEAGTWILSARYTTSNLIYQMAKLPREQWEEYLTWLLDYEYKRLALPRPDRVIFLDVPLEISQDLLLSRYGGDASKKDLHERDNRYLRQCRECALYAAERLGWEVIPCARDGCILPIDTITQEIWERL